MIINHDDAYLVTLELNKKEIEKLIEGKELWLHTWNEGKKVVVHVYNADKVLEE